MGTPRAAANVSAGVGGVNAAWRRWRRQQVELTNLSYPIWRQKLSFPPIMQFRRSNQGDDRRRRLLNEEVAAGAAGDDGASARTHAPPNRAPRYTSAAEVDQQPRVTDLIPQRKLTLLALSAAGLLAVGALEWLYALMPRWSELTTDGRVAALDLDGEGSLAAWFSSLTLTLAALAALLVYSLRRHRLDDYRARYRIWLAAAVCWAVMSIDEAGSLHEGFKEMMTIATGNRLFGDGSLWWIGVYGVVLGCLGLRLVLDMRECRASTSFLLLAAVGYVVAVVVQLELLMPQQGAKAVMLEEGCEMVGNLCLLLAMTLHARYIIRDIQGLVVHRKKDESKSKPAKKTKQTKKSKTLAAGSNGSSEAADIAKPRSSTLVREKTTAAESGAPASRKLASQSQSQGQEGKAAATDRHSRLDAPELDGQPKARLSKSQRRALRKQKRREERDKKRS